MTVLLAWGCLQLVATEAAAREAQQAQLMLHHRNLELQGELSQARAAVEAARVDGATAAHFRHAAATEATLLRHAETVVRRVAEDAAGTKVG